MRWQGKAVVIQLPERRRADMRLQHIHPSGRNSLSQRPGWR